MNKFDRLAELVQTKEDKPKGKGWMTFDEIHEYYAKSKTPMGNCKLRRAIRKAIELGQMESYQGLCRKPSGKINCQVWYRFKT